MRRLTAGAGDERGEDLLFAALTHPRELAQPARLGSGLQTVERRDAELAPDPSSRLRSYAGKPQELDDAGRHPLTSPSERVDLSVLDDLDHLLLDRLADSGEVGRLAGDRELGDPARHLPDPRSRTPVRDDLERLLAEDLRDVREQVELVGEVRVPGQRPGHPAMIGTCLVPSCACRPTTSARTWKRWWRLSQRFWISRKIACSSSTTPRPTEPASSPIDSPIALPWVSVLHRERKEGIGPAYVAGFRHALAGGAELVLEMDCDFSHDPADIPRLIEAAGRADLVLGSRYAKGGGTENWGLVRRFVSRGGCIYAQVLLGVRVRDLTGGFKCFRRATLEAIDLGALSAHGYAFQIEATYRVLRAGLTVRGDPHPLRRAASRAPRR